MFGSSQRSADALQSATDLLWITSRIVLDNGEEFGSIAAALQTLTTSISTRVAAASRRLDTGDRDKDLRNAARSTVHCAAIVEFLFAEGFLEAEQFAKIRDSLNHLTHALAKVKWQR